MYKIIGTDGKTYGPVSDAQLRQWIAQGRANGNTLIQPEGSADWKPLSSFPELASALPPAASHPNVPPPINTGHSTGNSRASNKIAAGILGILVGGFGVHKFILGYTTTGAIMLAVSLISLFGGFFTCGLSWFGYPVMHVIGLVEGVIYLTKSDDEFVRLYVDGRKEWF